MNWSSVLPLKIYNSLKLVKLANDSIKKFGARNNKLRVMSGIIEANRHYGYSPDEFFLFHYDSLTEQQRVSFIGDSERQKIAESLNDKKILDLLSDKWTTYKVFQQFFHRDACLLIRGGDLQHLKELLYRSDQLILKPLRGSLGKGVQILSSSEFSSNTIDKLLNEYPKGFIAEQLIKQDAAMATLHQESVNTLRIYTINYHNKVSILHPLIRIGRGKSIIDNAGGGGIITACDPQTGRVYKAVDEWGHTFEKHPDNGCDLIGFEVPRWKEAFQTAEKLALHVPDVHYAGWDMALTKNGWVLVEGNPRAQFLFQISEGTGFRDELSIILKDYGVESIV